MHNDPCECAICRRHAWGIGILRGRKAYWICRECAVIAKEIQNVKKPDLDSYERMALGVAGDAAGAYLDGIGCTDLAKLTEQEWRHFLETIIVKFGDSLRQQIGGIGAPWK